MGEVAALALGAAFDRDRLRGASFRDPATGLPTRGFIEEVAFDPLDFGMPPNSLPSIDPMQILALLATRDALADAPPATQKTVRRALKAVIR